MNQTRAPVYQHGSIMRKIGTVLILCCMVILPAVGILEIKPEGPAAAAAAESAEKKSASVEKNNAEKGIEALSDVSDTIKRSVSDMLGREILSIDQYPITVGKVLSAVVILIVGIIAVRIITWSVRTRILPRTHLQTTTAAIIEKVFYYFALVLVVLFSLRILNVPLTAFAFLGGALAIGLGFGAQNLVNNFISGFILMGERPIKIGDLVEVEGNFAVVEEIGGRCTRIRNGSNVHILVPNSSFLEKNIINWTLSDQRIRTSVSVGIVYGSPVREVERLLLQAADEHPKIIQEPPPFVLFTDFGDNALIFEVFFWVRMTRLLERRRIESDIRFRVDELFREAHIVIAFPQRDVHLDSVSPLSVKLVERNDEAEHPH